MSLLVHIIMTYIKENYTAHPEILGQAVNHLRCLWENLFARAVYRPHSKYSLKGLDYREWKKLESPDFLEECKRQKENYMKTSILLKKELQGRRTAVKERVQHSRDCKRVLLEQIQNEMSYASSSTKADTDHFLKEKRLLENKNDKSWLTVQKDKKTRKSKKKTPKEVRISSKKTFSIF